MTIIKYPVDYSGTKSDNLVIGEVRDLVGLSKKLFAPRYGAFYLNNLELKDFYTNVPLVPNIDFVVAQLEPTATSRSGLSVYQVLIIKNPSINKVIYDYQAVGGEYSLSADAIAEFIAILESDDRTVNWGDLIGVPADFPPTSHTHDASDLYGLEDVVNVLENMRQAILTGDAQAQEDTINWVVNTINQLQATQFATLQEAFSGALHNKAMSPFTTNKVITQMLAGMNLAGNNLEFSITPENDSWGYMRDKATGFTMCFGSSIDLAPEDVYRVNFKRRFNNIPLIISGDIQGTTDASSTGSQWTEVVAKIPQHTVDQTGFVAIGKRLSGSLTDTAKLKYLAIGISDESQPTTFTEGYPTTVPALPSQTLQPVWSGTNNITAVNALSTDTKRVGVVFPSSVAGGGYLFNTTAMTSVSSCYYTPFPGSFVDSDYEIMGHVDQPSADFDINMNYVGVTLDQWMDLSTLKANAGNSLLSGFVWTATGIFGGTCKLTITIRNKATPTKSATRVFLISQSSGAYDPNLMVNDSANAGFTKVSYNTNSETVKPLAISFAQGINPSGNKNAFAVNRSMAGGSYETAAMYGYYGPIADATTVENNAAVYEVKVVAPQLDGFILTDSEWPFDQWIGLDVLRATSNQNKEWIIGLTGSDGALNNKVLIYVRHKYDHTKTGKFTLLVDKVGSGVTPAWVGNADTLSYPLVGGNKTFSIDISLTSPAGVAVTHLSAGGNLVTEYLSYTYNVAYWKENEYETTCKVNSSIVGNGSFTSTGSPLLTWTNLTGTVFSWSGSNPTDVHMQLVVELTIRHKVLKSASATKVFTFDIYGYGYVP